MRKLSLEELKKLQVDILCKVDEFCCDNHINYTLAYGTMIGAIRHEGYIPWDDDIDIAMPRPDYDRFIRNFNGYDADLYVLAPELNYHFYASYANVCDRRTLLNEGKNSHLGIEMGVKIDIFPIDGTPFDFNEYKKEVRYIRERSAMLASKRYPIELKLSKSNIKTLVYRFLSIPYKYDTIQRKIIDKCLKYSFHDSEYVDTISYPVYNDTRVSKALFNEYIDVKFEHKSFKAIKEYDRYLKTIYGDYMKLPPVEKRVSHHDFNAFWK